MRTTPPHNRLASEQAGMCRGVYAVKLPNDTWTLCSLMRKVKIEEENATQINAIKV